MNDHPHSHDAPPPKPAAPESGIDAGSQALAEALRGSFAIIRVVMVILVALFLASGFFTLRPGERAIILRFGKPVGEGEKALLNPGLHWSYPYPIDDYQKVSVAGVQQVKSTAGWYATTPEQELAGTEPPAGGSLNPAVDGYVLTADGNIVHTRATLYYRIVDPIRYVFGFTNAPGVVQNALDNALVFSAAHFRVDDILTRDVAGFRDAVRRRVTDLIERQNIGVVVDNCDVKSVPPRQLKSAFDNVLKAEVTRRDVLNKARSYENQMLSKAGADATSLNNSAESGRVRLVREAASQAERFLDILPKYNANPALFMQYNLVETLGRVLTNVQDRIYLPDRADGKARELRLLLNREPPSTKTPTSP
jgi:modulator of FtsH protease HflK